MAYEWAAEEYDRLPTIVREPRPLLENCPGELRSGAGLHETCKTQ